MIEYTISKKEEGLSLFKFSSRILANAPNGLIYKFLRNKNIELNRKKADAGTILRSGDNVAFFLSDETFSKLKGVSKTFEKKAGQDSDTLEAGRILYEDDDYLFYDKPAGLRTQSDGSGKLSLNDLLLAYTGTDENDVCRPSVCNRLDTNTSGIVLCGRSVKGLQTINNAIRDRRIRKYYRAILLGKVQGGRLVSYISTGKEENKVSISDTKKNGYKEIITDLDVKGSSDVLTYAELRLITGRKHQIRAQMSHIGHPVAGDIKYGVHDDPTSAARQMLHSYRVELPEDILGGLTVFAEIPDDMRQCLQTAGIEPDV